MVGERSSGTRRSKPQSEEASLRLGLYDTMSQQTWQPLWLPGLFWQQCTTDEGT